VKDVDMKDKAARVTCMSQQCEACQKCIFGNRSTATDEWEMDLTLLDLKHNTTLRLDERIRLDTAIEASGLAG
jgi:hypothetical protein